MKTLILILIIFSLSFAQSVFINEIHYDNDGGDVDEGVEIAGPAGTNLNGWSIVPYNGSAGTEYNAMTISSIVLTDQQGGYGTAWVAISGLQNGAPDGIALVNASSSVVQFVSYEGSFTATDGPASGMTSTDIGASESSSTGIDSSLQLSGTGTVYSDFSWNSPAMNTRGTVNTGQTFQAVTNTVVNFAAASANVNEDVGSYDLTISISNPDGSNATSVDVVLTSGSADDLNSYSTQTVTFAAGSSADETVTLTITDDSDVEGDETLTLELQNVSGGNSAAIGNPGQFDLTIEDNDFVETPDIVINEIMQDPDIADDDNGEWLELYNPTTSDVDIEGWTIKDDGSNSHVIDNGGSLIISAGGYLVMGNNDTLTVNGGVTVDYVYPSNWYLSNGDDEVVLVYSDGVSEVDRVNYDGGSTFPDPTGKSMELNNPANDNNVGSNWAESKLTYGDGDYGTPGSLNSSLVSAIDKPDNQKISEFRLYANYPNPFNPVTTINYQIPKQSDVLISVYDALGQKVSTLVKGNQPAGTHSVNFDAQGFSSGVYYYKLQSAGFMQVRKMLLMK